MAQSFTHATANHHTQLCDTKHGHKGATVQCVYVAVVVSMSLLALCLWKYCTVAAARVNVVKKSISLMKQPTVLMSIVTTMKSTFKLTNSVLRFLQPIGSAVV